MLFLINLTTKYRSSRSGGALKNFTKFPGKPLCQSLFFNKLAVLRPATLLKKRLWHKFFPVNFAKFLRITFLQNTSSGCFWKCKTNLRNSLWEIYLRNCLQDMLVNIMRKIKISSKKLTPIRYERGGGRVRAMVVPSTTTQSWLWGSQVAEFRLKQILYCNISFFSRKVTFTFTSPKKIVFTFTSLVFQGRNVSR